MEKENEILHTQVFDFTIFPLEEVREAIKNAVGSNQKKLAVVLEASTDSKENLEFLSKILAAIKVDMANDVLLLKITPQRGFSFAELKALCPVEYLLGFGGHPTQCGIHALIEPYRGTSLLNTQILWADSLDKIAQQQDLKKALWLQLKEMFKA